MIDVLQDRLLRFYNRYYLGFWIIAVVIFIRACYYSFLGAIDSSLDMQWYPTRQLWGFGNFTESVNPYLAFLNGDTFMANGPNYMPLMYFFMYPFGTLEWESAKIVFAIFNMILFGVGVLIFYRYSDVSKPLLWIMTIFVLMGYTYGNIIGNAQSAIIVGFGVTLAYCFRHNPAIVIIGLSLVSLKHSFAIPIFLGFFLAGYKKEVIFACLVALLFVCLFAIKTNSSPIEILSLLQQVNASHYANVNSLGGPSDLISLSQKIFHYPHPLMLSLIVVIYLSFIGIVWRFKPGPNTIIACSILLSLFSLPHLGYDHYMLFIVVAIAYKSSIPRILYTTCVALFIWRGERVFKPLFDNLNAPMGGGQAMIETHWAMNMGISFCVFTIILLIVAFFTLLTERTKC